MDAMEFFQQSAGSWRSQRTTHHLAEVGESQIQVDALAADDPEIIALCEFHQIDASLAIGGCSLRWGGSMGWDQEGENHERKVARRVSRQGKLSKTNFELLMPRCRLTKLN
jgi:hypothetical protein